MTSSSEANALYGSEAVRIVVNSYGRITAELKSLKSVGQFRGNVTLSEVWKEWHWAPALLDNAQYLEFVRLTGSDVPRDIINALWYILENVCNEHRLMPAITFERQDAREIIILH